MNRLEKIQVFLLHFAGGNCYSFQFLKPFFPSNLEFYPLELPGRGKRMNEQLLSEESYAIMDYVDQIRSRRNTGPYIIYGHSMGASLGLRVTRRLEELGENPPLKLIVSGNAGPGTGDKKCRSEMEEEELKKELRILGGVPEELLETPELFDFFSPIMRADFKLLEQSRELSSDFRISAPIIALMGDEEETHEQIENWGKFTSGNFEYHLLKGNHFFIHDHPAEIMNVIKNGHD